MQGRSACFVLFAECLGIIVQGLKTSSCGECTGGKLLMTFLQKHLLKILAKFLEVSIMLRCGKGKLNAPEELG